MLPSASKSIGHWLSPQGSRDRNSTERRSVSRKSSLEDEDVPLARPIPRRDRFNTLSSFKWTLSSVSTTWKGSGSSSVTNGRNEQLLWQEILDIPRENVIVLGPDSHFEKRRKGTVCEENSDCNTLPRSPEEVRRRQEHVERSVVRMPALHTESNVSFLSKDILFVVRNGFITELTDLYRILWSVEARGFDVCKDDAIGVFEWFSGLERALARYLAATELSVYCGTDVEEKVENILAQPNRSFEKRKLTAIADAVARTRRAFNAGGGRAIEILRKRIDLFSITVSEFTKEECKQLPKNLTKNRFSPLLEKTLREMIRLDGNGESVALLSSGLGVEISCEERAKWISEKCDVSVTIALEWVNKIIEKHVRWVDIFVKADQEYRSLYEHLGKLVDDEIDQIHSQEHSRRRF